MASISNQRTNTPPPPRAEQKALELKLQAPVGTEDVDGVDDVEEVEDDGLDGPGSPRDISTDLFDRGASRPQSFTQLVDRNASARESKADHRAANLQSNADYLKSLGLDDDVPEGLQDAFGDMGELAQGTADLAKGNAGLVHQMGDNARETAGEFKRLKGEMLDRAEGEGQSRTLAGYQAGVDKETRPHEFDLRASKRELTRTMYNTSRDGIETPAESRKLAKLGVSVEAEQRSVTMRGKMLDTAEQQGGDRTFKSFIAAASTPEQKAFREAKVDYVRTISKATGDDSISAKEREAIVGQGKEMNQAFHEMPLQQQLATALRKPNTTDADILAIVNDAKAAKG
jgi:hypothetical protein